MLTIDGLKKLNGQIVYHPLGAIRLIFSRGGKKLVYHFYSDQSPMQDPTNLHNHPYTFTSKIFKGTLRNFIYDVSESETETKHKMIQRECCENSPTPIIHENVERVNTLTFDVSEGQSYNIHHSVIHRIELVTPKVISLLEKGPTVIKPYFVLEQHIEHKDGELFNLKPESECWEIIKYTLE